MASLDIYTTYFMLTLIREKGMVYSFLKDRYFPRTEEFKTEKVYMDYDDGEGNLLAPFVIPRVGKVPMERVGYETRELAPAFIAPSRPLSIDILTRRVAGESLSSTMTPEQRERAYLVGDLDFLDKTISRREEWMCAETMLNNSCRMEHVGDRVDASKTVPMDVYYYGTKDGKGDNPGVFKPSAKWEVGTEGQRGTWFNDVAKYAANLYTNGREASDLVVGSDVGDMILNDPWVVKMLDNRRIELGTINPKWKENGVVFIGTLNFSGIPLDIFVYRGTYQVRNKTGNLVTVPYFPKSAAMIAAPNTGILRYGMVTQIEMDKKTHSRVGTRIPKHLVDEGANAKETILTSRPIAAPQVKSPWRACKDVFAS